MNNFCPYTFAIKQVVCQGGVRKTFQNIYTGVPVGTDISLSLGYTLTFVSGTRKHCNIKISNPIYIPDINFNIPNGGSKIFDLPVESGTYRLSIAAKLEPAETECDIE